MNKEIETELLFISASRQKADRLFGPLERDLRGVEILDLPERAVTGYGRVSFLGISRSAFRLTVEESCGENGPFARTALFASTLDLTTGLQRAFAFVTPCGALMRVRVENLGAAAPLELSGYGLPHSSAAP